jgi:hypothetical protein
MNPLAILSAVAALAFFPGVAYASAVALAVAGAGRLPPGLGPAQLDELVAAVGLTAACGLLPLPGSPLVGLPTGVSLPVLIVALAAGVAWSTGERWPWHRLVAAAAAVVPLLALASVAMTLDLATLAAAGGPVGTARPWVVVAILLGLPEVARPFDPHTARAGRAALVTVVGLVCFSLVLVAPLGGLPAIAVAGLCALGVVVYAALIGAARPLLMAASPALGTLALVPAAIALAVVLW